jgi:hypothetical protein
MRIDLYTKAVLTVIALLLAVITFRPYFTFHPGCCDSCTGVLCRSPVHRLGEPPFFDTRTGELWTYSDGKVFFKYRLTKLGEPLVREK